MLRGTGVALLQAGPEPGGVTVGVVPRQLGEELAEVLDVVDCLGDVRHGELALDGRGLSHGLGVGAGLRAAGEFGRQRPKERREGPRDNHGLDAG